jgi:cell division protein FtsW (lipid II flippase)
LRRLRDTPDQRGDKWFNLYVIKLQPSELMKPVLILTLAYYLMYRDS